MISVAPRFAGVMQQQREQEKIEPLDVGQQAGESLIAIRSGLPQLVDIVDYQERMFIDGVAMVGISDYERIDAVKFRDQHSRTPRACIVRRA